MINKDMKYKGYNIGKISRYICNGYGNTNGYYWNVNKNGQNRRFDTQKEAKEWINVQIANKQ